MSRSRQRYTTTRKKHKDTASHDAGQGARVRVQVLAVRHGEPSTTAGCRLTTASPSAASSIRNRPQEPPVQRHTAQRRGIAETSRSFLDQNEKAPRGLSLHALALRSHLQLGRAGTHINMAPLSLRKARRIIPFSSYGQFGQPALYRPFNIVFQHTIHAAVEATLLIEGLSHSRFGSNHGTGGNNRTFEDSRPHSTGQAPLSPSGANRSRPSPGRGRRGPGSPWCDNASRGYASRTLRRMPGAPDGGRLSSSLLSRRKNKITCRNAPAR